ncbi:hypothetical protein OUZ56_026517 [Daphnia magna]|uniref:Uncharacterized protein n=1 Tax=Daphnia magna TaxID=35525 RepID=A0ABQ9ZLZ6_9CRUS|nr:hypothetical protein OUZ56_026517 [Daphnia magna]
MFRKHSSVASSLAATRHQLAIDTTKGNAQQFLTRSNAAGMNQLPTSKGRSLLEAASNWVQRFKQTNNLNYTLEDFTVCEETRKIVCEHKDHVKATTIRIVFDDKGYWKISNFSRHVTDYHSALKPTGPSEEKIVNVDIIDTSSSDGGNIRNETKTNGFKETVSLPPAVAGAGLPLSRTILISYHLSRTGTRSSKSHYSNQPPGIAPSRLMKSEGNWAALYTVAGGERCATKRGSSPLEIAAQVQEIQSRSKVDIYEKDHIGFDESGFFYSEIYGEVQSRFDGYVTSIATTDEVEGEDYDGAVAIGGRQTFTAPAAILNNVAGEDFDPFAEHRRSTIADREDEYRAMRWKLIISPERVDSFAEDLPYFELKPIFLFYIAILCRRSAVSLPTKDGTLKAVSVPSNGESRRPPIFRQAIVKSKGFYSIILQIDVDKDSLSPEELKERKIMTLLLKIKNGTPPMRKSALRQITDKAREFGAITRQIYSV